MGIGQTGHWPNRALGIGRSEAEGLAKQGIGNWAERSGGIGQTGHWELGIGYVFQALPRNQVKVNSQQSTVNSQQSTVNSQQSTVNSQQLTVNNQQLTVN
ncbi:hypothetical protein [Tychonema sp. LEGE 06208]|uniref:hypothetical protein n=1 Tax=Tychonema sp. LEGE 06208 TaxID=1828663 RepID=UPI0030DA7B50